MKKLLMYTVVLFSGVLGMVPSSPSYALQESVSHAYESRIKTYVYKPEEVFIFTGHYRYVSVIYFDPTEEIDALLIGDPTSWDITNGGNRLIIKPIEPDATTNLTITTDRRQYLFELYAEEAEEIRDEKITLSARFVYPDEDSGLGEGADFVNYGSESDMPDYINFPERYNFHYTVTGSRLITPIKMFDDGAFTYFEFRRVNADVPAIYHVDKDGNESLVNYRVLGNYIVVERVSSQYTLRLGDDIACVFNELNPLERPEKEDEKFLGIF